MELLLLNTNDDGPECVVGLSPVAQRLKSLRRPGDIQCRVSGGTVGPAIAGRPYLCTIMHETASMQDIYGRTASNQAGMLPCMCMTGQETPR
ncbi:hypothetical protein NWFMUON74_39580 [Nocardia wallacei]|uniref:Uncharacterized protein n=1 Tax=Nocardia wallacei TaxID=480035 RepID=A0A7G1KNS1_9NOCA|nr:hypothetical protein NWFMUON74_39580 [Nocardia wallacei]